MRNGTRSRVDLLDSDSDDSETDNDIGTNNAPSIINVDIHIPSGSDEDNENNKGNIKPNVQENITIEPPIEEECLGTVIKPSNSYQFDHNTPPDRFNYSYLVFYLLGTTTMCPWNFFVTAENYWMYKFRNVTDNSTTELTPWQKSFESDLSVTAAMAGTTFLVLNAIYGHLVSLKVKMTGSMIIILGFFIITTAFVEVDTDKWQAGFFAITLGTVIIINSFSAIMSGGLFGIAGLFPSEYMTAVVSGQALGGIFTALAFIVALTFGASPKTTAFAYFSLGTIILCISIVTYITMSRTSFFHYHLYEKSEPLVPSVPRHLDDSVLIPDVKVVFGKIYLYALIIFLVFLTSLSVYPAITVLVQSQNYGNGKPWNDIYFVPVVNYLTFNSGDYFGRILAGLYEKPNNPHLSLMWAILRMGFVPAFLVSNLTHTFIPTLITSDVAFIILMAIFATSNGYFANNVMIHVPRIVSHHEKEMASSIMVACQSLGLAVGAFCSMFLVQIL